MELLKENIYTEYMEEIVCYCKKTDDTSGYSKERQRWLGSQYRSSILALQQFPIAFLQGKWDLCEKLFQWLLLIPFPAHLIYHDMCRSNDVSGAAACYKMVCTFSRFIHHFFDRHARRGNQPQIPERFLVSAHIGSHLFHEPHHKNL